MYRTAYVELNGTHEILSLSKTADEKVFTYKKIQQPIHQVLINKNKGKESQSQIALVGHPWCHQIVLANHMILILECNTILQKAMFQRRLFLIMATI